jgi:hypothetical protein
MLNTYYENTFFLLKQATKKGLVSIITTIFICSASLIAQECFEIDKQLDCQKKPIELEAPSNQKPLRDDQYSIGFMPGFTNSSKLFPIFSYSVSSTFKFQKKDRRYGFWIAGTLDHSFLKSHERFLSYNPKSDTSYVMHWDIALLALHFGWDWTLSKTDKAKFYFRLGLNAGGFIHRNRTVKTYDYSQDGKLISETFHKIGPPIGALNLGFMLGFGLEYYVKPKQSISFTPTLYSRGGGYYGMDFSTFGIHIAYNFGLSKNVKR